MAEHDPLCTCYAFGCSKPPRLRLDDSCAEEFVESVGCPCTCMVIHAVRHDEKVHRTGHGPGEAEA